MNSSDKYYRNQTRKLNSFLSAKRLVEIVLVMQSKISFIKLRVLGVAILINLAESCAECDEVKLRRELNNHFDFDHNIF